MNHAPLANIIAHRGASGEAPENTIAALQLAIEQGARCVEIDVMISADGIPLLHHDDKLGRRSDGQGYVCAYPAATLRTLNAARGLEGTPHASATIPLLSEVLALLAAAEVGLNLEIKPTAGLEHRTAEAVCQALEQADALPRPLVLSSFSERALQHAHRRCPEIARALIVCAIPDDWSERLQHYHCANLHCAAELLQADDAHAVLDQGYGLYTYTVNDVASMRRVRALGAHGVFSDFPARLLAASGPATI